MQSDGGETKEDEKTDVEQDLDQTQANFTLSQTRAKFRRSRWRLFSSEKDEKEAIFPCFSSLHFCRRNNESRNCS